MIPLDEESLEASLAELKAVYRVLSAHRAEHPELEGNTFVESLRTLLEEQAVAEGIDLADESAFQAWLAQPGDADDRSEVRELN